MIQERPERPPDESSRLAALHEYEIIESEREPRFDRIAALAAGYFHAPIALVSLIDEHRLWVKAAYGTDIAEIERDLAFCAYTVLATGVNIIPDTLKDPRFCANDLVTGCGVRFYAGAPLISPDGFAVGALSIIDVVPRTLGDRERAVLADFATIVIDELELRKTFLRQFRDTERLRSILAASPLGIYSLAPDGRVMTWNPGAEHIYGWSAAETIGLEPHSIDPDVHPEHRATRERILSGEPLRSFRVYNRRRRDGTTVDLNLSSAPIRDADGTITSTVVLAEDVTLQVRAERRDRHRSRVLELAATGAPRREALDEIIAMIEGQFPGAMGVISLVNGERLQLGAAGPTVPPSFAAAVESIVIGPVSAACGVAAHEKRTVVAFDMQTEPSGKAYHYLSLALGIRSVWSEPIIDRDGIVIGTIALNFTTTREPTDDNLRELTDAANLSEIVLERYSDRANLERLALYDSLTALPNRVLFTNRLKQSLEIAERVGKPLAVGMIDLDRFKAVNDTYGHRIGDDVLVNVARVLADVLRPSDTIARRGGDEFLLLLPDVTTADAAQEIGERLRTALSRELAIGNLDIFMRASIGIALIDPVQTIAGIDERIDRGLQEADLAMYEAKKRGDSIVVYSHDIGAPRNYALEPMLVRARALDEFVLYYQPQIDTETGALIGCEALLRWNNPRFGLLYPGEFLNVAEESGVIVEIGAWVIEEAVREARRWHDRGERMQMAVNISPRQFETDDLVAVVSGALERSGFDPAFLDLEISEKLVVGANDRASTVLRRLKALGVRLSIDDFGTGYSNLASLHVFNVDAIKIDKSFVDRIALPNDDGRTAYEIVKAIVSLARALGLSTIAEGVETLEQQTILRSAQCLVMQGYLWSPALSATAFTTWRDTFAKTVVA